MEHFSQVSHILQIIAKYEKRGKYLPILHEATWDNHFILKCLLKSNVAKNVVKNRPVNKDHEVRGQFSTTFLESPNSELTDCEKILL